MNELDFKSKRTGELIWDSQGFYYRFELKKLPMEYTPDPELFELVADTHIKIGELKGITSKESMSSEESKLILRPFILKEATLSSNIEGIHTTLPEIYLTEKKAQKDIKKDFDYLEILNYEHALEKGLEHISNGGDITEEFIKELHTILLDGARGHNKNPGKYKDVQNAIGSEGDSYDSAKFVPASPETTPILMENLVKYINEDHSLLPLFKMGIIHYQFETIHPFRDGNGRLGRLLIMLLFKKYKLMEEPLIFMSEFFMERRDDYIDLLYAVSSKGKVEEWIKFFIEAVNIQAKRAKNVALELKAYKKEVSRNLRNERPAKTLDILDMLFKNPYLTVKDVKEELSVTDQYANKLIKDLEEDGILIEITGNKRNKVYLAKQILKILDPKNI
ncbi:Fic family protein [Methanococcus maripaludis]|uniref:Fic family protein n=1 Tax=Methanococcus maripaludis TaxID=39152 RepID=A0A7J9PEK9_METMI|nr:Fic family protein [Methanococcus maripaludis]MBA2861107.1 Fic family protein [Methanococcus maripaludis]